jgi:glycosyltransferase involved in cell wall biosynthesis
VTRLVWRRWEGRQPTGIDRVCLAYLDRFGPDAQAVVQHRHFRRILDPQASAVLFGLLAETRNDFRSALISAALRYGLRRGCEARRRLYLNVGHTGLNNPGFRAWVGESGVRPIYFVHDLIPITHPEFCRAGEAQKHRERMRTVLDTGIGVIANSRVTLDDLAAFARDEQLASVPAIAAPLGSDAIPALPMITNSGPPIFVILGTIEARKNHLMLLHVWTRLIETMGSKAPRLLVIGQRGWECQDVFDLLDRSPLLKLAVTEIGRCDDQALARHLAAARALLFPSLVEGYGLPLAEALRSGVPVIASNLPVFREIAGDVPDYLDPLDGPAWERTILAYASDRSPKRHEQLRRLSTYRPPVWADHFETVSSWLATLT